MFAQDDVRINDTLSASISARLDVHSKYGVLVNPRVSLLARPSDAWTMRVSTGLGTFAPTPFTEETEEVGFSRLRFRDDLVRRTRLGRIGGRHTSHAVVRAHGHRVLRPASAIP